MSDEEDNNKFIEDNYLHIMKTEDTVHSTLPYRECCEHHEVGEMSASKLAQ